MDGFILWELVIACNTCDDRNDIEEMHIVPDKGKIVCKRCSLKEETQVILMRDMDESNPVNGW